MGTFWLGADGWQQQQVVAALNVESHSTSPCRKAQSSGGVARAGLHSLDSYTRSATQNQFETSQPGFLESAANMAALSHLLRAVLARLSVEADRIAVLVCVATSACPLLPCESPSTEFLDTVTKASGRRKQLESDFEQWQAGVASASTWTQTRSAVRMTDSDLTSCGASKHGCIVVSSSSLDISEVFAQEIMK